MTLLGLLVVTFLQSKHGIKSAFAAPAVKAPHQVVKDDVAQAVAEENKILKQYSIEELNGAATYLLAIFEASLDGKKTPLLACDPQPSRAQFWLSGPLRALIDEKASREAAVWRKNVPRELKKIQKKWADCAHECQCNAYLAITELIESKDKAFQQLRERLTEENKKQSTSAALACAAKQNWFCKSPLEAYLSKTTQPAEGR